MISVIAHAPGYKKPTSGQRVISVSLVWFYVKRIITDRCIKVIKWSGEIKLKVVGLCGSLLHFAQ